MQLQIKYKGEIPVGAFLGFLPLYRVKVHRRTCYLLTLSGIKE